MNVIAETVPGNGSMRRLSGQPWWPRASEWIRGSRRAFAWGSMVQELVL